MIDELIDLAVGVTTGVIAVEVVSELIKTLEED